jgi:type IV secretion system protein VirB2
MTARAIHRTAPTMLVTAPCRNEARGTLHRPIAPVRLRIWRLSIRGALKAPRTEYTADSLPRDHICRLDEAASSSGCPGLILVAVLVAVLPEAAYAGSPFATGANATQQQLVAILTPLAAVAVMVSGAMAWFGRLSWWWMVAVVIGTVLVFGGPQIVSWIRGLFGV